MTDEQLRDTFSELRAAVMAQTTLIDCLLQRQPDLAGLKRDFNSSMGEFMGNLAASNLDHLADHLNRHRQYLLQNLCWREL